MCMLLSCLFILCLSSIFFCNFIFLQLKCYILYFSCNVCFFYGCVEWGFKFDGEILVSDLLLVIPVVGLGVKSLLSPPSCPTTGFISEAGNK